MEELVILVAQVLLEILGQVLLEIVGESILAAVKVAFDRPGRSLPVALLGLLLLGGAVGGVSLLVWPHRLVSSGPVPGLSLVAAPLGVGLAMGAWGAYRRTKGRATTRLASFSGGAAFALGTALVRFIWAA